MEKARVQAEGYIRDLPTGEERADQIAAIRSLLPETGSDPVGMSSTFGRKSAKREWQIEQVLDVLESLGRV